MSKKLIALFVLTISGQAQTLDCGGRTPTPGNNWVDSVEVNGKCYCASTNFDHDIGIVKPEGYQGLTVKQICNRLGAAPAGVQKLYNDIQCGNGPANTAWDEQPECCPGRVDQGVSGCQTIGPKWDKEAVLGPDDGGGDSDTGPAPGDIIALKASNGKYVASENGKKSMNANRSAVGAWEIFQVVAADGDKISLQGSNGMFVSSENGNKSMNCNRPSVKAWEQFTVVITGPQQIALQGNNGKYVSSENGTTPINCNRSSIGAWETFSWEKQ